MGKRLWDLAKSRFEIATILLGHRHIVHNASTLHGPSASMREGGIQGERDR